MASRRLGPLTERNFCWFFAGRQISLIGSALAPVALTFAVIDDLNGSARDLGFVLAAGAVPTIVLLLAGGVWGDRLDRRTILVAANLTEGLAQGLLATLLLVGVAELWHVAALSAMRGVAGAFFLPAARAVVPDAVSAPHLQAANALLGLSISATSIVGHAASGLLVATIGAGWAIAVDGVSFIAAALILSKLQLPSRQLGAASFMQELREGWREIRARTWLLAVLLQSTLVTSAATAVFLALGPTIAKSHLGGPTAWGLILAAMALGYTLGGLVALQFRPHRPIAIAVAALVLSAPQYVLLAEAASLPLIALSAILAGIGFEQFGVLWTTTLQERIPTDRLARVSSYDSLGGFAVFPVALVLVGPLADGFGTETVLWATAIAVAASTAGVLAVNDVRRLTRLGEAPSGRIA